MKYLQIFRKQIPSAQINLRLVTSEETKKKETKSEHGKCVYNGRQNGSNPFISEKNVPIIGFMVFKLTGSDSQCQRGN